MRSTGNHLRYSLSNHYTKGQSNTCWNFANDAIDWLSLVWKRKRTHNSNCHVQEYNNFCNSTYTNSLIKFESLGTSLLSVIDEGALIVNSDHIITGVNANLCEWAGMPQTQLTGKYFGDFLSLVTGSLYSRHSSLAHNSILYVEKDRVAYKLLFRKAEIENESRMGFLYTIKFIPDTRYSNSENIFRDLFINSPVPTLLVDTTTLLPVYTNLAAIELYGYTQEEFKSIPLKKLRPEGMEAEADRNILQILSQGKFSNLAVHVTRQKRQIHVLVSGSAVAFDGRSYILVKVQDITRLTEAEKALQDTVSILKTTMDAIQSGILVTDKKGNILTLNQRMSDLMTLPLDFVKGKNHLDLVDVLDNNYVENAHFSDKIKNVYQNESINISYVLERRDGRIVECYTVPRFQEGIVTGRIWVFSNITDRVKAEEERNNLAEIIEQFPDAISFGRNGMMVYLNKAAKKLIGLKEEESSSPITALFPPDSIAFIENTALPATVKNGSWIGENVVTNKDGKRIPVTLTMLAHKHANGKLNFISGLIQDISAQKEYEQALKEKNKKLEKINGEMDRFIYSASHELRSPLCSIMGLIQIAELENASADILPYLNMMKASVNRLDNVLQGIIHFSRANGIDGTTENIVFEQYIPQLIGKLSHISGLKGSRLAFDIAKDTHCLADPADLYLIISNLLSNAVKFSFPDKPVEVRISARTHDNMLILAVEDNGIGIDREYCSHIFDMFFRVSEKYEGSGLGLYIVKEVVEKLKGSVHIKSSPGAGSCFTVMLPQTNMPAIGLTESVSHMA